jgi:hypothetical protein
LRALVTAGNLPGFCYDEYVVYICTALLSRAAGSAATRRFVLMIKVTKQIHFLCEIRDLSATWTRLFLFENFSCPLCRDSGTGSCKDAPGVLHLFPPPPLPLHT